MGKTEEHEGKKYLIIDDHMIDKVLDKPKDLIGIEICHDTKIWINVDDKLSDDITLKRVVILMACVIKEGNNFYPSYF